MTTIYVKLMGEGTNAWRPVEAISNVDGTYTIASIETVPEDEIWEFLPGQKVVCKPHTFSESESELVAYARG